MTGASQVMRIGAADSALGAALRALFARHGLITIWLDDDAVIPGSYWGDCEAGLVKSKLYVRADTPVHSALHEGCHYLCADDARRANLHTDVGGSDLEECAVCYLSIVLAAELPGFSPARMLEDMDAWGYSFRLGSAARWLREDAEDARAWLVAHDLPSVLHTPLTDDTPQVAPS